MTMTTHYRVLDRTLCGIKVSEHGSLKNTQRKQEVTCRRCLKGIPGYRVEEVTIEPNTDAFVAAVKAFTDLLAPIIGIQARIKHLVNRIKVANQLGTDLTLDKEETQTLAVLLVLLQK